MLPTGSRIEVAEVRPRSDTPHLPHLDSLRGIAALLVVFHHARLEAPPSGALASSTTLLLEGHLMVTFFIILSGYCLGLPTLATGRIRGGLGRFFARRARRLMPAYYATLAGSLLLIATLIGRKTGRLWDESLPVDARAVFGHIFLLQNLDMPRWHKIDYVLWSIAVEWQIYFAFPIFLFLARRVGIGWMSAVVVSLGYLASWMVLGTRFAGLTPHFYGMFALGMLASRLAHGLERRDDLLGVTWWKVAGLALVATYCLATTVRAQVLELPFGIACAAALVALGRPGPVRKVLEWGPLVTLGGFSYSLYLIHAPLLHLAVMAFLEPLRVDGNLAYLALTIAGIPPILALSALFARAFERPFLASKPGRPAAHSVAKPHLSGESMLSHPH